MFRVESLTSELCLAHSDLSLERCPASQNTVAYNYTSEMNREIVIKYGAHWLVFSKRPPAHLHCAQDDTKHALLRGHHTVEPRPLTCSRGTSPAATRLLHITCLVHTCRVNLYLSSEIALQKIYHSLSHIVFAHVWTITVHNNHFLIWSRQ